MCSHLTLLVVLHGHQMMYMLKCLVMSAMVVFEVTQLENQVTSLTEKLSCYENLEERMTQLMQLVQNQQNHSSEASRVLNFNVLRM